MKRILTIAALLALAGCSAPAATVVPSSASTKPTTTIVISTPTATRTFDADEVGLLTVAGFKTTDPGAGAYIDQAHKLCTTFAATSDEDVFQALKDAAEDKRIAAGQILMLLCGQPDRYPALVVAASVDGSLASGTYYVGTGTGQIPPGKYKTLGAVKGCYWVRKNKAGDIIDNDLVANAPGGVKLTVKATDYEVTMTRCGIWVPDKS